LTGEAKGKERGGDKPTEAMKMRSGRVDERIALISIVESFVVEICTMDANTMLKCRRCASCRAWETVRYPNV
jgi:hypothetical protein